MALVSSALVMQFTTDQGEKLEIKVNRPAADVSTKVSAAMDTIATNAICGKGTTMVKQKAFLRAKMRNDVSLA